MSDLLVDEIRQVYRAIEEETDPEHLVILNELLVALIETYRLRYKTIDA